MAEKLNHIEDAVAKATTIDAATSTRSNDGKRLLEVQSTKPRNHWHSVMNAHIGNDDIFRTTHPLVMTVANVYEFTKFRSLRLGGETTVLSNLATTVLRSAKEVGQRRRPATCYVALHPGKRCAMPDTQPWRLRK